MGLLARLLAHLDDNLSTTLDRHLAAIEVPKQRLGHEVYDCCGCCAERFAPASCPLVPHRRPCPECEDAA